MGLRILVTGGAGFIGSHLADRLVRAGDEVHVLDDLSTGHANQLPPEAELHQVRLQDKDHVAACVADVRPELVYHLAAQPSVLRSARAPEDDARANILGSLHLLESVRKRDVRMVFASTGGAIYGEVAEGRRAKLDDRLQPLSPYGIAKAACERYLHHYGREYGLHFSILRLANIYGPRQDPAGEAGVVAIFKRALDAGEALRIHARRTPGDGGCIRDYVHVDDAVEAFFGLRERGPALCQLGSGVGTSTRELAEHLRALLGETEHPITEAPRRLGDLGRVVLEPDLPVRVSLTEGLRQTFGATA
ncbi:MAG: NAD-dependent epimerase/dehydratase family protein [Myxococcota bacterium]